MQWSMVTEFAEVTKAVKSYLWGVPTTYLSSGLYTRMGRNRLFCNAKGIYPKSPPFIAGLGAAGSAAIAQAQSSNPEPQTVERRLLQRRSPLCAGVAAVKAFHLEDLGSNKILHMYIGIYIHTHIKHTSIHPSIHPSIHACMHACMHTYTFKSGSLKDPCPASQQTLSPANQNTADPEPQDPRTFSSEPSKVAARKLEHHCPHALKVKHKES